MITILFGAMTSPLWVASARAATVGDERFEFGRETGTAEVVTFATVKTVCEALADPQYAQTASDHPSVKATCDLADWGTGFPQQLPASLPRPTEWSKTAGAVGGRGASTALTGLADLLLERANAELTAWMAERVSSRVCKEGPGPGDVPGALLLPETCELLTSSEGARALLTAGVLQGAAAADALGLGWRVPGWLLGPAAPKEVTDAVARDALVLVGVAGRVGNLVANGETPVGALSWWVRSPRSTWNKEADLSAYPVSSLAWYSAVAVLSWSDPRTDSTQFDVATGTDQKYGFIATAVNATYLDHPDLPEADRLPTALVQGATRLATQLPTLLDTQNTLLDRVGELEATWKAGRLADKDAVANTILDLAGVAGSTLEMVASLMDVASATDPALMARVEVARGTLRESAATLSAVAERDLSGALYHLVATLDAAGAGDAIGKDAWQIVRRWLLPAAMLADSKDAESAKAAWEAWADPPDSYLVKRADGAGAFVGVNGYVGVGGALEIAPASSYEIHPAAAPAIQVGLDMGRTGPKGWYKGLFLSALDLGALAETRLGASGGAVDDNPTLTLEQALAPGAHVVVGFPKSPLSLGLGGSWVPALRSVDGSPVGVVRPELLLAVDVPLYRLNP